MTSSFLQTKPFAEMVKSRVRRIVLGDEDSAAHPSFTGKYVYRGLTPMSEIVALLRGRVGTE